MSKSVFINALREVFHRASRRVARLIYPYGAVRRVLRGPARGARFIVSPAMGVNYALGTHAAIPRELVKLIRPGMTVFDVGANEGQMALAIASLVGPTGAVVAIEPVPECFTALQRNLALSGVHHVRSRQVALSDSSGLAKLLYYPNARTQNKLAMIEDSYRPEVQAQELDVAVVSLDLLATTEGTPDLLKIDVEGAAAGVLRGARGTLAAHAPVVYIELHGPEEQAGVRDSLVASGYTARRGDGSIVRDPTAEWVSPMICRKEQDAGSDGLPLA